MSLKALFILEGELEDWVLSEVEAERGDDVVAKGLTGIFYKEKTQKKRRVRGKDTETGRELETKWR